LRQILGFGPLVSTATVAATGNGAAFRRGRDFAAWVGVVPRQYSTRGKQKLFGISKRGNIYLRRMLIHGARAVLLRVKYDTGGFGQWVHRLAQRAPRNKSRGRDREQAGSHGLGRVVQRPRVSTSAAAAGGRLMAVEKTLRLESTERFPLSHRHDDENCRKFSTKVC
jgi:hypothetical protein